MLTATLTRFRALDYCTLGRLSIMDRSWSTIEPPRRDAGRDRVPVGRYRLERHHSEAHANSYALVNPALGVWRYPWEIPSAAVEGIALVLICPMNWAQESIGSIGPGKDHKQVNGMWQVVSSRAAMNEIIQLLQRTIDIELLVEERFQTSVPASKTNNNGLNDERRTSNCS